MSDLGTAVATQEAYIEKPTGRTIAACEAAK